MVLSVNGLSKVLKITPRHLHGVILKASIWYHDLVTEVHTRRREAHLSTPSWCHLQTSIRTLHLATKLIVSGNWSGWMTRVPRFVFEKRTCCPPLWSTPILIPHSPPLWSSPSVIPCCEMDTPLNLLLVFRKAIAVSWSLFLGWNGHTFETWVWLFLLNDHKKWSKGEADGSSCLPRHDPPNGYTFTFWIRVVERRSLDLDVTTWEWTTLASVRMEWMIGIVHYLHHLTSEVSRNRNDYDWKSKK